MSGADRRRRGSYWKMSLPSEGPWPAEVDESRGRHMGEDTVARLRAERRFFQGFFRTTGKRAGKAVARV